MVKNLSYRYREIVPVQRYISFTGIYHWYGKKMRNPTYLHVTDDKLGEGKCTFLRHDGLHGLDGISL